MTEPAAVTDAAFGGIATRYDTTALSYQSMITLATSTTGSEDPP